LDPAGSCRKEAEKSPDPAGKQRKQAEVEAVFPPEICWIFSGVFQSISRAFLPEPARNFRPGLVCLLLRVKKMKISRNNKKEKNI
jgi:hypothetical protein